MNQMNISIDRAATVTETSGLRYLEPARLQFHRRGPLVHLTVEAQTTYLSVSILRVFPLSAPHHYLSVRDINGDEIGVFVNPDALDAGSQAIVRAEAERRYLLPVIQRILRIKERFETIEWQVETDHGVCQFTTRSLRDNIMRPSAYRCILTDVDGNRFDIPDVRLLSLASQAALFQYL